MTYSIIDNKQDKYLLFLHCICGNNNIFKEQFKFFKDKYNFILVELPAHEMIKSDVILSDDFTFKTLSKDIIDILIANSILNVDVISLSLGSMILDEMLKIAPKGMFRKVVFTSNLYGFPYSIFDIAFNIFTKVIRLVPTKLYMHVISFLMLPLREVRNNRIILYNNSLKMPKKILIHWIRIMNEYILSNHKNDFRYLHEKVDDFLVMYGQFDLFYIYVKRKKIFENSKYWSINESN